MTFSQALELYKAGKHIKWITGYYGKNDCYHIVDNPFESLSADEILDNGGIFGNHWACHEFEQYKWGKLDELKLNGKERTDYYYDHDWSKELQNFISENEKNDTSRIR